eukprot:TRINITY_DN222_c0_g1_i2.p1 TRINITY_DN222_c0_g1~~TRINITY_DN222_c0_g1_i2.p1  ORF type:complete len:726 (+),score=186.29 TRINITY_DN222_c0_g1_i2:251-2428(+)
MRFSVGNCVVISSLFAITAGKGLLELLSGGKGAEAGEKAVSACIDKAPNEEAKKACRFGSKVKDAIAASSGRNSSEIDDASIAQILRERTQKNMIEKMQNCSDRESCLNEARAAAAAGLGMKTEDIDDLDLEKNLRAAGARKFMENMKICSADAEGNQTKLDECKEASMNMTRMFLGGDKKSEMMDMMKQAALTAAAKARETCMEENMTKEDCETNIREAIAAQYGMKPGDMTKLDVKTAIEEAAMDKARDAAAACVEAKSGKKDASCSSFFEEYAKVKGGNKKTGVAGKIDEERVKMKLAADSAASTKRLCFSKKDKQAMISCINQAKDVNDNLTAVVFEDRDDNKISKKQKLADREASVSALGSTFADCMATATEKSQKADCKSDFEVAKEACGISWNSKAVLTSHRGKKVANAASNCDPSEAKSCRREIKDSLKDAGMEEREYRVVKLLGAIKNAAETWAACKENSETETECDAQSKQAYLLVSGEEDKAFSAQVKAKIRKLAQALIDGTETEVRSLKAADVAVTTNEVTCSSMTAGKVQSKVDEETGKNSSTVFGEAGSTSCVVVDDQAEYALVVPASASATNEDIDAEASIMAQKLDGISLARRLRSGLRRLTTTQGVSAAQSQEECSVDDAQCGNTASGTTTAGTGTTAAGTGTTAAGTGTTAAASGNTTMTVKTTTAAATGNTTMTEKVSGATGQTTVQAWAVAGMLTTVYFALMITA